MGQAVVGPEPCIPCSWTCTSFRVRSRSLPCLALPRLPPALTPAFRSCPLAFSRRKPLAAADTPPTSTSIRRRRRQCGPARDRERAHRAVSHVHTFQFAIDSSSDLRSLVARVWDLPPVGSWGVADFGRPP